MAIFVPPEELCPVPERIVCMCFEALEQFELSLRADQVVLWTVYLVVCVTVDVIG